MYTLDMTNADIADVAMLKKAAYDAFRNIPCTTECGGCPYRRACRALSRLTAYAETELIKRRRAEKC